MEPIGSCLNGPLKVGPENRDVSFSALRQNGGGRKPEKIIITAGKDNGLRKKVIKEEWRIRVLASVMGGHQEQLLGRCPVSKKQGFYGLIDIPREDERGLAEIDLQHQ